MFLSAVEKAGFTSARLTAIEIKHDHQTLVLLFLVLYLSFDLFPLHAGQHSAYARKRHCFWEISFVLEMVVYNTAIAF